MKNRTDFLGVSAASCLTVFNGRPFFRCPIELIFGEHVRDSLFFILNGGDWIWTVRTLSVLILITAYLSCFALVRFGSLFVIERSFGSLVAC